MRWARYQEGIEYRPPASPPSPFSRHHTPRGGSQKKKKSDANAPFPRCAPLGREMGTPRLGSMPPQRNDHTAATADGQTDK